MSARFLDKTKQPAEVISIPYSVHQTALGKYFFGQTELLTFGDGYHAWGGLINPAGSKINLFWNVFTVSNFSSESFTVEFWLKNSSLGKGAISSKVSSANQAIVPVPRPKVELQFADRIRNSPTDGIFSFIRRVEPAATLTRHDFQGMIILPPRRLDHCVFKITRSEKDSMPGCIWMVGRKRKLAD